MGYRIIYETEKTKDAASSFWRRFLLITVFFCCFLQIISCLWPAGEDLIRSLWVFEDVRRMIASAEVFAQELAGNEGGANATGHFLYALLGK